MIWQKAESVTCSAFIWRNVAMKRAGGLPTKLDLEWDCFFVGGGGVVGCGKVYNWYTAALVFDTNTITCSKTSCIFRASRGALGLLLSFMTCSSNLRSFSSIQCLFHCTKQIVIVTSCCCLPLLSLLHCIALQSVCAKRHLRWLEFRGQERSRGSTLCCFHLLAILLLLSLSTNWCFARKFLETTKGFHF